MKDTILIRLSLWIAGGIAALLGFISWADLLINTFFFDELIVMLGAGAVVWLVKRMKAIFAVTEDKMKALQDELAALKSK